MRPVYLTASGSSSGVSKPCVLDQYLTPSDTLCAFELKGNTTGSPSYAIQVSPDDPFAAYATDYNTNGTWYTLPGFGAMGADAQTTLATPWRAVRLLTVAAGSAGTATPTLTVIQAGAR